MKSLLTSLFFVLQAAFFHCHAQSDSISYQPLDSSYLAEIETIMIQEEKERKVRSIIENTELQMMRKEMQYDTDGWAYIIRGLTTTITERDTREVITPYRLRDNHDWSDYAVAAVPLAAAWISKISGVPSRSTYKRMAVSNAIAMGLSLGLSTGLKNIISEDRPDGTDDHSMPSRHSALAFAGATILHREFGHISPWISVGAYAAATTTMFLRFHHNRHWINDIYLGAGIGTVSTHFAYYLTDRILGAKQIHRPRITMADINRLLQYSARPTALSFVSGIEAGKDDTYSTSATFTSGLEYSYFLNPMLALEAMGRISMTHIREMSDNVTGYHLLGGIKYSVPAAPGIRFGARLFGGSRFMDSNIHGNGAEAGAGLFMHYTKGTKYIIGFNCDFAHTFADFKPNVWVINMVYQIIL